MPHEYHFKTYLTDRLQIKYPLIVAPMFLVSNVPMLTAAFQAGAIGCIPALNFKKIEEFESALVSMDQKQVAYGVNLIVSSSNPYWNEQLEVVLKSKCKFVITSLGNPETVIKKCAQKNIAVFCDVVDRHFAQKVAAMKPDALIAVNSGAGGHLGKIPGSILVPMLKNEISLPIINAGGVGNGEGFLAALSSGAVGVSMGSPFLASQEAPISDDYKKACLEYGAEDIVTSTKISGTPCTVINTPYVQKIGTEQNVLEKVLNKNKKVKKYLRMLTYYQGMKLLEKAAFQASYKNVWCAGPSIEFTEKVQTTQQIIEQLMTETYQAKKNLDQLFSR
jgi:nitronate monooxygenase